MSFAESTFSYSGASYPKITQSGTDDTASFLTAMEGISSVNVTTVGDQSHSTFKVVDFGGNALHIEGDLDIDFGRQIWIFKGTGHRERLYVKSSGTLQLKSPQTENGFSFNPEVGDIIYAIEGSSMGWNSKALRVDNNTSGKSNFIGVNFRGEFSATITGSVRFENCIIDKIGNDGDIQFNISNTTEMVDCKMYASGTSGITFRGGTPTISNVQIYGARDSFNNESNVFQIIEKLDSDTGARADISQFGGWKTGVKNAINGTRFLWAGHLNNGSAQYSAGSLEVTQGVTIKVVDDSYTAIPGAKFYLKDDASLATADLVTATNSATPFSVGELSQGNYVTDSGTLYITKTNVSTWEQGKKYGGNSYVFYNNQYYKSTTSNNYSQPDVADWNLLGNTFASAIEFFGPPSHTLTNLDTSPATTQRTYEKTTDANGEVAEFEILIGEGFSPQGDTNGSIRTRGKNPVKYYYNQPYSDDLFDYGIIAYDRNIFSTEIALRGADGSTIDIVMQPDFSITESAKATVDAYTVIDTPQKFYDAAKAYLVDNYAGEIAPIVSRDGNTINAGSYNMVVDASASSAFSVSGTTITIKASTFVGNILTGGTAVLSNGAKVVGTYKDTTVLPWAVKNVEATSRIQIYNITKSAVVHTEKLNGTAGTFIDVTGSYTNSEIAENDVIRLRVTCVVGATAMLPVETTGVGTSTGLVLSVSQVADEVYNANAINGSTVSTLSADYSSPMGVDLSDADGIASVKEIYAFFTYSTTTADGVNLWFGGMRAIDNANYEVVVEKADIKIQNIGSSSVIVSDGRMYRNNGTSVLYAENGDKPIVMDSGALVTSVQPQVESALNANAKVSSINNNSKLIPSLL